MNDFIDITEEKKDLFNEAVTHPLQSFEWGEFRKSLGTKVIRRGKFVNGKIKDAYSMTLHRVPKINRYIGYLPKGKTPSAELIEDLKKVGSQQNCIFIQLEPNALEKEIGNWKLEIGNSSLRRAAHPLFTKYTFVLDLTKSEEDLLKSMHSKTRYNIKVAQRYGVEIKEDKSKEGFKKYLGLMEETTKRQQFYAHDKNYHETLWKTLSQNKSGLSYYLLHAYYKKTVISSWVLFAFGKNLYYPYGASSRNHRETMASNLLCWEVIKFGKKLGLTSFDMWGALGPDPVTKDPWYGFHKFKQGYGGELTEFVGSYDLVLNKSLYEVYKLADKIRWIFLKLSRG